LTAAELRAANSAVDPLPVYAPRKERVLRLIRDGASTEVVAAVEADVGLTLHVLRTTRASSAAAGVQDLSPAALERSVRGLPTFVSFHTGDLAAGAVEAARLHALAVRTTTEVVSSALGAKHVDELVTVALIHDFAKVASAHVRPAEAQALLHSGATPEERVEDERRALGIDHARLGAEIADGWGFPTELVEAIGEHHSATAGSAATVRVADMLAHYGQGRAVDLELLIGVGEGIGLSRERLQELVFQLPFPATSARENGDTCPLSERELQVVRRLAEGMVYKQVAQDLGIATSTVRNHMHRVYRRLGAADKTQAVLLASERGWL
jgi:putative nucleotidyltransferase with HDIG domain